MKKTLTSLAVAAALVSGVVSPSASAVTTENATAATSTSISDFSKQYAYDKGVILHTVRAGESLSSIATRYGVVGGYKRLAELNNITNPNVLKVNQVLQVPFGTYTVKPGEGWYAVARNTGVSLDSILALNNATLKTPLYPYQILSIAG